MSRGFPTDILTQAADTLLACKRIDPKLQVGTITQAVMAGELAEARTIQQQIDDLEIQLADLRNKRDARLTRIWDWIKRMRATVKGAYGDDSPEYDLVGGTRASDRKHPGRRSQP